MTCKAEWARRLALPKFPCPMCRGIGYVDGILCAPLVVPCGCLAGRIVRVAVEARGHEWPVAHGVAMRVPIADLQRAESRVVCDRLARAFAALGYAVKARRAA